MQPLHLFNVVPKLPAELEPLRKILLNLWWTWQPQARALFRHLDPELWDKTNHNPLRMHQLCRQARLTEVSQDDDFLREMQGVYSKFCAYMDRPDTYGKLRANSPKWKESLTLKKEKKENHKTKIENFLEILSFLFCISSPRTFTCKRVTLCVETGELDGILVADKCEC